MKRSSDKVGEERQQNLSVFTFVNGIDQNRGSMLLQQGVYDGLKRDMIWSPTNARGCQTRVKEISDQFNGVGGLETELTQDGSENVQGLLALWFSEVAIEDCCQIACRRTMSFPESPQSESLMGCERETCETCEIYAAGLLPYLRIVLPDPAERSQRHSGTVICTMTCQCR